MFAILVFGGLWGFPGMLLGVPIMAVIYYIVSNVVTYSLKKRGIPETDIDYVNLDRIDKHKMCIRDRIIILSAKTEDSDKILGLNIGADDYVEKPFNPLELVARVKSQLRRYTQLGNAAESGDSIYTVGGLSINDDLKEVTVDGEVVKLTPIEYNILLLLVKNQGKVF